MINMHIHISISISTGFGRRDVQLIWVSIIFGSTTQFLSLPLLPLPPKQRVLLLVQNLPPPVVALIAKSLLGNSGLLNTRELVSNPNLYHIILPLLILRVIYLFLDDTS